MDLVSTLGAIILALVALWLVLIVILWLIRPRDVRAAEPGWTRGR